jgi:alkylhydroperoxidase family enzyme
LSRQLGISDEVIEAAAHGDPNRFDERERLVLRFAEAVTRNVAGGDTPLYTEMQGHFTDEQIIELLCAIGLFNYMNRFSDTLRIALTAR